MMFNKLSSATILALAASASAATCPETLDGMYKIDDVKTLYYAVVPSDPDANNGILCARLEAAAEVAWLGFGISTDGQMIGSEAIIGDSTDVKKYSLGGKSGDAVVEMASQTLMDTMFEVGDGMTKMTFTKLLMEDGEIPILPSGENTFLHSHGSNAFPSYHDGRGMYKLDVGPKPMPISATTTAATTAAPGATTAATTAAAPAATTAADATTAATTAAAAPETTTAASGSMSIRAVAVAATLIVPSLATMFLA